MPDRTHREPTRRGILVPNAALTIAGAPRRSVPEWLAACGAGGPATEGAPAVGVREALGGEFGCTSRYSDATPDDCAELRFAVTEGEVHPGGAADHPVEVLVEEEGAAAVDAQRLEDAVTADQPEVVRAQDRRARVDQPAAEHPEYAIAHVPQPRLTAWAPGRGRHSCGRRATA